MCDPITIAATAATIGSTVVNSVASNKAAGARDDVLAAERIRQRGFDQEAQALNTTSQDRYVGSEQKQEARAKSLSDYFTTSAPPDAVNPTAGTALPSSTSDIVVREMEKQSGAAKAFTDQQGGALGSLRAFGDVLGDNSRLQARDASLIGQIGGFKRGSANVNPLELEEASHAGDKLKVFADILAGIGTVAGGYGLTKGPAAVAGKAGIVTSSGVPIPGINPFISPAGTALKKPASLFPLSNIFGGA